MDLDNRLGVSPATASVGFQSATLIKIYTANPLGASPTTEEVAIVKDFAGSAGGLIAPGVADINATLADIEQSGYRLRRIVGKLGFSVLQGAAQALEDGSIFHVTAGFIIRRVNEFGQSMAILGAGAPTAHAASTASLENTMDPWIWRRSWDISDNEHANIDPNVVSFPRSNYNYGAGIFDGPHVDAKTARVVGPEERLFLDVTIEGINGQAQGQPGAVLLIADLRVLASMRTNSGNRRNASR